MIHTILAMIKNLNSDEMKSFVDLVIDSFAERACERNILKGRCLYGGEQKSQESKAKEE
jgi:hypothetical protein